MYLKTWVGVIGGSLGSRNVGYPEEKKRIYPDIESLAKDFGTKNDEKYYKLTRVDEEVLKQQVIDALNSEKEKEKEKKAKKIEDEISKLQDELKKLK